MSPQRRWQRQQIAASLLGLAVVVGFTAWARASHAFKHNGADNATIQNIFTYGAALLVVIIVVVEFKRSKALRQKRPVATAIEAEPAIFTIHVGVSFANGEKTFADLVVREQSFELTGDPDREGRTPWSARGSDATVEVSTNQFGVIGYVRQCFAVTFPDEATSITLWLLPGDSQLRPTWDALVRAGVAAVGTPPE